MTDGAKTTPIRIDTPGAVRVSGSPATLPKTAVVLNVDLSSKRAVVSGSAVGLVNDDGAPEVFLAATEETIDLDPDRDRDDWTIVSFPEYVGYSVLAAVVSRYTLTVVLYNYDAEDEE